MSETIFSKILDGSIPSYKVYEDELVYAFLDISPATIGHTLVIPKKFATSVIEADEETIQYTFLVASKLAKHIMNVLGATGVNLLTNAGTDAGQVVMHWHVHIIPRYAEDGVGNFNFNHKVQHDDMQTFFQELQDKIKTEMI